MPNDDAEEVMCKECLTDVNVAMERGLVYMTPIVNSRRILHQTQREAEDHGVSNVNLKSNHGV